MKRILIFLLLVGGILIYALYTNSDNPDVLTAMASVSTEEVAVSMNVDLDNVYRGFLININKKNPLPSGFEPDDMVNIYETVEKNITTLNRVDIWINRTALEAFTNMVKAAQKDGLNGMNISSGYRSYDYQNNLFNNKVNSYINNSSMSKDQAVAATSTSIAYPGTSEHQTGLVIDIGTTVSTTYSTDKDRQWYSWLDKNCWDYGYIIRYQEAKEDVTGYVYEPWHLRYVGLPHSQIMKEKNFCLEEYVDFLAKEKKFVWRDYQIEHYEIVNGTIPADVDENTTMSGDGSIGIILTKKL